MAYDNPRLLAVFSSLLAPLASGCGVNESQFSVDVCNSAGDYSMLESVMPASEVDYLDLRQGSGFDVENDPPRIVDSVGTACSGATDPEACASALAALSPQNTEFVDPGGFDFELMMLAYTRGDEVASILDEASLLDFLGDIDTPGEAALRIHLDGQRLVCDADAEVGDHDEGFVVFTKSGSGCGAGDHVREHVMLVRTDGTIEELNSVIIKRGSPGCVIGRLPAGLCGHPTGRARGRSPDPAGSFLAQVAQLEAASVPAFEQLARELATHRAPASFVRRALRSRNDEVRHARLMARFARRYGGQPEAPRVAPTPLRPLAEVAAENAVEGCIRETYGALVAHVQAQRAATPALRRAFRGIARDETRHAQLSWDIARWAGSQLGPRARARLASQRAAAVEQMRVELTGPLPPRVHAVTGLPEPDEARKLFDGLEGALARA